MGLVRTVFAPGGVLGLRGSTKVINRKKGHNLDSSLEDPRNLVISDFRLKDDWSPDIEATHTRHASTTLDDEEDIFL